MKLLLVLSVALVVVSSQSCSPPAGSSYVTKTVTTTTTTLVEDSSSGASGGALSAAARRLIRSTWDLANKKGNVPPKVLYRFLEDHPEYQKLFKSYADVPLSQLKKNGYFLAQAYTIAAGLDVVIQSLDSQQLLAQRISELGVSHFPRSVKPHMFQEFAQSLTSVLSEELGSSFTDEAKEAFALGFRLLVSGISKSLMREEDVAHPITGLSPRQIENVRTAWEPIRSQRVDLVTAVFKKLFVEQPELASSFPAFAGVALSDLSDNEAFQSQMNRVADRLDNMFATLDKTLTIMGQFQYMGHSHAPRHVGRPEFEKFGRYFLEQLVQKGVSNIESFRDVLRISVDKIMQYHY